MRTLVLFATILLLALSIYACGPGQEPTNSMAPTSSVTINVPKQIGDPTADDAGPLFLESSQEVANGTLATYRNGPRMVKILYTKDGTLVCDYPIGFIGPIPYGHAREDGTV